MSRPVWARVDFNALHSNLQLVRTLAPGSAIMAVVKANAYGHGAVGVARSIRSLVDGYAVAGIDEAEELASAGIEKQIFLLSGFHERPEIDQIGERGFIPVIHSWEQIQQIDTASVSSQHTVWVKFDSGMHRIGFPPEQVNGVLDRLGSCAHVKCAGLMSHLACADDRKSAYNDLQIELFDRTTAPFDYSRSLANSAGVCAWPRSHHDWVRPGILMYGCTPLLDETENDIGLRPVMSLCSKIIAVHRLKRGDRIGYGGDWCCPEDMRVGVVACGYGDGYPRHAPSGTPVWIRGQRAGILGRVSMDMMTVDLRGLDEAEIGDVVELWGKHVTATEVATSAGTISYEILSGVTGRVPRIIGELPPRVPGHRTQYAG